MFKTLTALAACLSIASVSAHAGWGDEARMLERPAPEAPATLGSASLRSGGDMTVYRLINEDLCEVKVHEGDARRPKEVFYLERGDEGFERCRDDAAAMLVKAPSFGAKHVAVAGAGGGAAALLLLRKDKKKDGPGEVPVSP